MTHYDIIYSHVWFTVANLCNKSHQSFYGVWNAWGDIYYICLARSLAFLCYPSFFFSLTLWICFISSARKRSWGINHKSWLQHFFLSVTSDTADKPLKIPSGETTAGMAILDESRLKGYRKIKCVWAMQVFSLLTHRKTFINRQCKAVFSLPRTNHTPEVIHFQWRVIQELHGVLIIYL